MTLLRRFWIEFEAGSICDGPKQAGVTAYSLEDALELVKAAFEAIRPVDRVIEDVDVSTLDERHVLPNMAPPVWRGVWYPIGFMPNRGAD